MTGAGFASLPTRLNSAKHFATVVLIVLALIYAANSARTIRPSSFEFSIHANSPRDDSVEFFISSDFSLRTNPCEDSSRDGDLAV